jgi:hypothetical protein
MRDKNVPIHSKLCEHVICQDCVVKVVRRAQLVNVPCLACRASGAFAEKIPVCKIAVEASALIRATEASTTDRSVRAVESSARSSNAEGDGEPIVDDDDNQDVDAGDYLEHEYLNLNEQDDGDADNGDEDSDNRDSEDEVNDSYYEESSAPPQRVADQQDAAGAALYLGPS